MGRVPHGSAKATHAVRAAIRRSNYLTPPPEDEAGALFAFGPKERPTVYVRVEDATPGPDGARAAHRVSAPPHVATAREAVAWTFGVAERRCHPTAET